MNADLGSKTLGVTEEEHCLVDVCANKKHCKTVDTKTESAVRRTSVLEELKIELNVVSKTLFLCLSLKNVVSVLTLCTRCNLYAAPDKVVTLGIPFSSRMW